MRTYTKREIAHILAVSPRTIAEDAKFLGLKPTIGDRGMNLYNQSDFNLISQLREHCANPVNTRDSFVPTTAIEVVEEEPKVSKMVQAPHGGQPECIQASVAVKLQNNQLDQFQESLAIALEQDPLFDLELLQRVSNNRWLLPAKRLAPLFGVSVKYLNTQKQYYYCGFIASKEAHVGGKILWKITANNS